jgi:hypothetical protein
MSSAHQLERGEVEQRKRAKEEEEEVSTKGEERKERTANEPSPRQ